MKFRFSITSLHGNSNCKECFRFLWNNISDNDLQLMMFSLTKMLSGEWTLWIRNEAAITSRARPTSNQTWVAHSRSGNRVYVHWPYRIHAYIVIALTSFCANQLTLLLVEKVVQLSKFYPFCIMDVCEFLFIFFFTKKSFPFYSFFLQNSNYLLTGISLYKITRNGI